MLLVFIKRPWYHHLILAIYLVSPLFYFGLLWIFHPFRVIGFDAFSFFIQGVSTHNQLLILLTPFVIAGLYFRHWGTYCLFFLHVVFFVGMCLYRMATSWDPLETYLFFIYSCFIFIFIAFIMYKDFWYPYFQSLRRYFRRSKRVGIWHRVMINDGSVIVNNLSLIGCFVLRSSVVLPKNQVIQLTIKMSGILFYCNAKVVREEKHGYGLEFFGMTKIYKKILNEVLSNRSAERFRVDIPAQLRLFNQKSGEGRILDISATGCFFETQAIGGLSKSQPSEVKFLLTGSDFSIPAIVAWINQKKESDFNTFGIGLKFLTKQNDLMDFLYDFLDAETSDYLLRSR